MKEFAQFSVGDIALEDFFKNPEKTTFQISPDGKHIAFFQPWENRMNIFVQPTEGGELIQLTKATERSVAGYFWANNDVISFWQDKGGDENFSLYTVNIDGTNEKHVTPFDDVRVHVIDELPEDDKHVIIGMNKRNKQIFDAYRLNLETSELKMIAENPGNIAGWMTDHDGQLRIAYTADGVNTGILYRKTEADDFEKIIETNFKETFSPRAFTYDNKKLYVMSNLGRDTSALYLYNPETKEQEELLYERDDVDLGGLIMSDKRKVLTGVSYYTAKAGYHFFDDERKAIQDDLEAKLPDLELIIVSTDKAEEKCIIRTYSDKTLGSYYFYDVKTKDLKLIAEVSPWIKPEKMAEMKPITYTSRDGLTINAYLTLPPGKENAKNLPVVINPHGGPWARDRWGFNPEVQFLANRGYAVLQMNFRGSTGFGRKFWELSFKQWGRTMQDDVTDGVKYLIGQGIADPKRIAIYGASYGGYATLAGIVYTPELYSCAVDYVGVSNLFTLFETLPPYWEHMRKMMEEQIGNPETEKDLLKASSPIYHIENIRCPLFVAQGANDPRVKKEHSDQIVDLLKEKNISVEYMVKDNEGHGFHNEENRFDFYRAMEKFLAKHL